MPTVAMFGYIYILQSNRTGRYYVGSSNDPCRRLVQHNQGLVRSTSTGTPWTVVFTQKYYDLSLARRTERHLKKLKSRVIIEKIVKDGYCSLSG